MTTEDLSPGLVQVLAEHRGMSIRDGKAWCTCGALLWTSAEGFVAGELEMIGSIAETAHTHHLANVLLPGIRKKVRQAIADARGEALRDAARQCYNGAPDPLQEYYDLGVAQWLIQRSYEQTGTQGDIRHRRDITDRLLTEAVKIYLGNPRRPVQAVQRHFGVSQRMAGQYISHARKRGMLPPTVRGKKTV